MRLEKYVTEHLICYCVKNDLGQTSYQILENGDKLVAIYIDRHDIRLAEDFPIPENSYKYFDEMCVIVQFLNELMEAGE